MCAIRVIGGFSPLPDGFVAANLIQSLSRIKRGSDGRTGLSILREFLRRSKSCFNARELRLSSNRKRKGVRRHGERLYRFALMLDAQGRSHPTNLLIVRDLGFRLLNLELGTHFLDLRGLLFYCCRKTSNGVFQFRDSLLLFLEFPEHGLRLCGLWTAPPQLFSRSIDKVRA